MHEGGGDGAAIPSRGGGEGQHLARDLLRRGGRAAPLRAGHERAGLAQRLCGDRLLERVELGRGPRLEQERVLLAALVDASEEARGAQLVARHHLTHALDALQRRLLSVLG